VWLTPRLGRFTPGKTPGTHCIGGWVCLRAGLDAYGKPPSHQDFCVLLYSVLHPYLFLYLDFPAFCILSLLTPQRQVFLPSLGFEPANPASDGPQILALDVSANGIGRDSIPGALSPWRVSVRNTITWPTQK
jgi:hypothetical protein